MADDAETVPHGLLLGWEDVQRSLRGMRAPVWDAGREGHLLTVGPTGSGKGVGSIIPALLTWNGPAIVIDPKGENYAVTADRRRAMGQQVHVLDPFRVTRCPKPDSLNPFDLLANLRKATRDEMRGLADAVAQEPVLGKTADPYWNNRATSLITAAIHYCARFLIEPTFADVRLTVENFDIHCAERPLNRNPVACHPCTTMPFDPPGMATERTRACITSTAVDLLAFITEGPVEDSLSTSTISLDDIKSGAPTTLYIVIPPHKLMTHGKLVRLWLITLLNTIAERKVIPRRPTLFILDETAQLGEMKQLIAAIAVMRGYGMRIWTFFQDLDQLRSVYPNTWQSIVSNSSVTQIFGISAASEPNPVASGLYHVYTSRFPTLGVDELALYRRGRKAMALRKPNYLENVLFEGLFADNPFHAPPVDQHQPTLPFRDGRDGATILRFPDKGATDA